MGISNFLIYFVKIFIWHKVCCCQKYQAQKFSQSKAGKKIELLQYKSAFPGLKNAFCCSLKKGIFFIKYWKILIRMDPKSQEEPRFLERAKFQKSVRQVSLKRAKKSQIFQREPSSQNWEPSRFWKSQVCPNWLRREPVGSPVGNSHSLSVLPGRFQRISLEIFRISPEISLDFCRA